ncbi:hypothetical protein PR003_g32705 [Phytophthora rubi]|uniref:Uncharacterized protein n=1 Tax=Phytophthora rubi TaxID=129364 RepID=A0A6A4AVP0_9STRA|nr:hypothetical protein PR003_g32705 [Phytophthora rubi]
MASAAWKRRRLQAAETPGGTQSSLHLPPNGWRSGSLGRPHHRPKTAKEPRQQILGDFFPSVGPQQRQAILRRDFRKEKQKSIKM